MTQSGASRALGATSIVPSRRLVFVGAGVAAAVIAAILLLGPHRAAPASCCAGPRDTLTTAGSARLPRLSPDGDRIAYTADVCAAGRTTCRAGLFVQDLPGGAPVLLDSTALPTQLVWTRAGRSLIYGTATGIFEVGAAPGPPPRRLAEAGLIALDRTGDTVAMLRSSGRPDTLTLTFVAVTGGTVADRIQLPWTDRRAVALAWSPDARWLAVSGVYAGTDAMIYLMSRQGRLADSLGLKAYQYAEWDRGSNALYLFVWKGGGEDAFVRLPVDNRTGRFTGTIDTLFTAPTGLTGSFSVAGHQPVLAHVVGARSDSISGIEIGGDATSEHLVRASTGWQYGAQLSPNGRSVALILGDSAGENIYTMPFAGGHPAALTATSDQHTPFAWYPDGTQGVTFVVRDASVPFTVDYPSGRAARIMAGSAVGAATTYTLTDSGGAYQVAPGHFIWLSRAGAKLTDLSAPENWSVQLALHDHADALLTARDRASGRSVFARMTPRGVVTPLQLLLDSSAAGATFLHWHGDTIYWAKSYRPAGAMEAHAIVWRSDGHRVTRIAELPASCSSAIVTMSDDGRRFLCERTITRTNIVLLHDFNPAPR